MNKTYEDGWNEAIEFLLTHTEHGGYNLIEASPFVCVNANIEDLLEGSRQHILKRIKHWQMYGNAFRNGVKFPKTLRQNGLTPEERDLFYKNLNKDAFEKFRKAKEMSNDAYI